MVTRSDRGSVLVEFALVSLVLYALFAASIEFGRLMFSAQALQDVARVAARELAVTPLPANITFEDALAYIDPVSGVPTVKTRIFDPACLVVDLDTFADDSAIDAFFAGMPLTNKALRPLMVVDHPGGRNLLRYPGALLADTSGLGCAGSAPTGLTIGIPRVAGRTQEGFETIEWIPVLEEIRTNPADPSTGPFSLAGTSPQIGLAAIRINYPYQAAMISGFQPNPAGPFEPNIGNPILADDAAVQQNNTAPGNLLADDPEAVGANAGQFGLGRQFAFAGRTVRPFRKLLAAQAIYRREVFQ